MPAVLVDVGYHLVEPNTSGQTVSLSVMSTEAHDPGVAGFDLKAQIVTSKSGPRFQAIRFAGDLWNTFPHIESGGPLPFDRTLAAGDVAFTQGFEARANGTLVTLMIDTTGIPAGSYEFRLVGTRLGSSSFRRADGSGVSEIINIKNGTLQVRSIWQNPDNPNDVNGDGRISPLDALLLLNELSKRGSGELEMPSSGEEPSSFFDVNGDGFRSPNDALHIINCLNELGCETSPAPILAQVTPDFEPDLPDATGVSTPGQTTPKPKSEDEPSDEVDSSLPLPCADDELDEDGNPSPGNDPESCEDSESVPVEPLVPVTSFPEPVPTTSGPVEPVESADALLPATPIAARVNFAPVASSRSVDAVIVEIVNELFDNSSSDELIELGLSG